MRGPQAVIVPELSEKTLKAHYAGQGLLANILAAFAAAGKKQRELTSEDFARVDAFHIRGRAATAELAGRICWPQGARVLDLGCAIGGSARYLAGSHNCQVTAIDIIEEYIITAAALTDLSGLSKQVKYSVASVLQLPFADSSFDMVWTEHVQMNIADKKNFYSEIFRVLAPGGLLLFHDLFRQQQGWFQQLAAQKKKKTTTFPGMRLLMGESAGVKIKNLRANLDRNLVAVYQAVLQKAG